MILAWAYLRYGKLPAAEGLLYGIKPVIIAVVVQALLKLAPKAARTWPLAMVAWGAALLAVLKVHELWILLAAGVAVCLGRGTLRWARPSTGSIPMLFASAPVLASAAVPFSLEAMFLFFLKVGAVLYGSGYVLLAFLQADLVDRYGWLTSAELLDAVAAGQVTPGPVFSTATFIGYLVAVKYGCNGPLGALVATLGIFLPAYVFVALSVPLLARLRRSAAAGAFLDGLNAASLALMAVVSWHLGKGSLVDLPTILLALVSGVLLLRYRVNSLFLILAGGFIGLLWRLAGIDLGGP
jgi:chromate transporter